LKEDVTRAISFKPPARKSARKRTQRDYADLHTGVESDPNRWLRMLQGKAIDHADFKRMDGQDVNLAWLEQDEKAMQEPIIIENPEGLGMKMPSSDLTVQDVAEVIGETTQVEVIGEVQCSSSSFARVSCACRCSHAI
jgi:F-box and leucine-rich repeat protein 10/11